MRHAKSNLALAKKSNSPEVILEHLCFEAQQAAEKAVKAVLVFQAIDFPRSHDIGELLELLPGAGIVVPEPLRDSAAALSPYAVDSRYPGLIPPISQEDYQRAISMAEEAIRWAESIIG